MYRILKRSFDIFISVLGLLILLPFFLVIGIVLTLTGEGEVFYLQERVGYKNKLFNIIKFATMLKDSKNIGAGSITVRNDPRVTKVGKFLRMTKINELPQLINVLINDMSIVGPRPLLAKTVQRFPEEYHNTIYNSKPGITSITALVLRDEERVLSNHKNNVEKFYHETVLPYKCKLESWYQNEKSILNDFLIIFLTAWVIIFPTSQLPFTIFKGLPIPPKAFNFNSI